MPICLINCIELTSISNNIAKMTYHFIDKLYLEDVFLPFVDSPFLFDTGVLLDTS
jgi:hypothetical protein